jgi:hypothetical protein
MRRKIFVFLPLLLLLLFWGYEFIDFTKLVYLKVNNKIIDGKVTDIIYKGRGKIKYFVIEYTYEYNNQKLNGKSILSINPVKPLISINKYLDLYPYRINENIELLKNNYYKFPKNEIEYEILHILGILLLTGIPIILLLKVFFNNIITVIHKKNIFYEQDKNYKIKESIAEGIIDYHKIVLKKLIEGTIICYGIKKGKDFIELSYYNGNYIFRINKDGKEEEIIYSENKNIKKYFKELVNKYNNSVRPHIV